jgi:hypothetical protein
MTGLDELIAFVRRCLDEDERVAREAEGGWTALGPDPERTNSVGRHAARWDPVRVLAEVAAKRRILDDYDIVVSAIRRVDDVDGNRLLYARLEARESDIRWLAQPYAGHEGWREEWVAQP